jgi:hypothetical protein
MARKGPNGVILLNAGTYSSASLNGTIQVYQSNAVFTCNECVDEMRQESDEIIARKT